MIHRPLEAHTSAAAVMPLDRRTTALPKIRAVSAGPPRRPRSTDNRTPRLARTRGGISIPLQRAKRPRWEAVSRL